VLKTGVAGLVVGVLYVLSGSLLWRMIAHTAVDLRGGAIGYRLLATAATATLADHDESGVRAGSWDCAGADDQRLRSRARQRANTNPASNPPTFREMEQPSAISMRRVP
jgi:hypothetical protein